METNSIKELFNKYILIWIWSIFVSINTALSYNIFNVYNASKWEQLSIFLIPIYILAVFMAITSWISLFNFFKVKILPLVLSFNPRDIYQDDSEDKKEYQERKLRNEIEDNFFAYRQLKSSFYFIILAICFRFMIPIIEMVFDLIYR